MNYSKPFPKNFLWGAATASHQIEGGLENNWTEWEKRKSKHLLKKSKRKGLAKENFESNSYLSCDSFNHWMEDIGCLKDMGLNIYRFSVEWSRIEPSEDNFSEEGISYYINILEELKKNGIEAMLTLWHWTIPVWLEKKGGVLSDVFVERYLKYVDFVSERLGKYVKYWITVNEPESFVVSHLIGKWPPQMISFSKFNKLFLYTFVEIHKKAYVLLKKKNPEYQISIAKNCYYIKNDFFLFKPLINAFKQYLVYEYLDRIKEYVDFLGINYYMYFGSEILFARKKALFSDMNWYMKPSAIYPLLKDIYKRYSLPIIVTENGLADERDKYREWWIEETLMGISKALEDGIDLMGYTYWSLLDNFEWDSGFWPKFGLVEVDPATKKRSIKKSGYFYRDLIKEKR